MRLYDYFRSSAAYRVRIALALKGLDVERIPVNLAGGEQGEAAYGRINAQHLVPALETDAGVLTQSLAIIEYLDEIHPRPPLLDADPFERARLRGMAQIVACDIHPLNNLRVLNHLRGPLGQDESGVRAWIAHWIRSGFAALEALSEERGGDYLGGATPRLPDLVLVPQMMNARRFEVPVEDFPRLLAIDARCREHPAFAAAAPERTEAGT